MDKNELFLENESFVRVKLIFHRNEDIINTKFLYHQIVLLCQMVHRSRSTTKISACAFLPGRTGLVVAVTKVTCQIFKLFKAFLISKKNVESFYSLFFCGCVLVFRR